MQEVALKRKKSPEVARQINQCVGRRVRALRASNGHSQEHLAQILGLSFQQVQKFESGASRISPDKLLAIARYYDHAISWFFEDVPAILLPGPQAHGSTPASDDALAETAGGSSRGTHYRLRLEVGRELQQVDDRLLRPLLELLRSAPKREEKAA